ncbi:Golgin subfamily A member 7/ERF4 family-domain-containing protein [Daldinia loculata]|uniref:Golgin subfamily A member 7/ERF4 family-domain-containing protein n=1 Tax=Daldinia loculata TaxID=103429 RepID=UPI0020C565E6|nr:Golgin subfamily A member 7/ERF4 family-domain-containing protein [Daldinia loculata]KAI1644521.1 Golgin subfamily A member 7/ERF4 family-domain-containing protein [Daldinia loculata]
MSMPLRCSILVLEVPNYYCRTSHQQQQQQQHQHPHPRPDQPLTTAVLLVSPSPAESSLASIPLDRVCVCTCVYLCNTRPQRQPSSQKSNLPSKAQYNKSGRQGGHFSFSSQTASHADTRSANPLPAALDVQQSNAPVNSPSQPSQQPEHPTVTVPDPAVVTTQQRQSTNPRRNLLATGPPGPFDRIHQSPFHNRVAASTSAPFYSLPRRFGPGRLWNPTNSTPRVPPSRTPRPPRQSRKRRPSTPPPPSVPVNHPTIEVSSDPSEPIGFGAGDYPLLPLPDKSTRTSPHLEGRTSFDKRISLPLSLRHSYDGKRISNPPQETEAGPSELKPKAERAKFTGLRKRGQSVTKRARAISFGLVRPDTSESSNQKLDKGKGKATMPPMGIDDSKRSFSKDLERGPSVLGLRHNGSNVSLPPGMISGISSSNSSILGDPDQPDLGEEWGPQHPCYPHLNPHVPINSPEYASTRIIRIRRDWLVEGDLAPTFSNLYPEILDPAGVSEQEFRRVIEKLNGELVPIFSPYNWRNILDGVLGLLTGWIWDDLGLTHTKMRLRQLEDWIDKWNMEMEKAVGSDESTIAPKIISLRRTGYMNLDFQIPDPEIAPASTEASGSRSGPNLPVEPQPAVLHVPPIEA